MDTAAVVDLGRQALWTAVLVCAPLLVVALAVGRFGQRRADSKAMRAFTAGLDLKELGSTEGALGAANAEGAAENPVKAIEICRKPVVGAINGEFATLGLLAGYYRRWVDAGVSRLIDIWMAFPPVLLSILLVAVLGFWWLQWQGAPSAASDGAAALEHGADRDDD